MGTGLGTASTDHASSKGSGGSVGLSRSPGDAELWVGLRRNSRDRSGSPGCLPALPGRSRGDEPRARHRFPELVSMRVFSSSFPQGVFHSLFSTGEFFLLFSTGVFFPPSFPWGLFSSLFSTVNFFFLFSTGAFFPPSFPRGLFFHPFSTGDFFPHFPRVDFFLSVVAPEHLF